MSAQPAIEDGEIFNDALCPLIPRQERAMKDALTRDCPEEALYTGVVLTVPSPGYARD